MKIYQNGAKQRILKESHSPFIIHNFLHTIHNLPHTPTPSPRGNKIIYFLFHGLTPFKHDAFTFMFHAYNQIGGLLDYIH